MVVAGRGSWNMLMMWRIRWTFEKLRGRLQASERDAFDS
jgi:hypothetical protein